MILASPPTSALIFKKRGFGAFVGLLRPNLSYAFGLSSKCIVQHVNVLVYYDYIYIYIYIFFFRCFSCVISLDFLIFSSFVMIMRLYDFMII